MAKIASNTELVDRVFTDINNNCEIKVELSDKNKEKEQNGMPLF